MYHALLNSQTDPHQWYQDVDVLFSSVTERSICDTFFWLMDSISRIEGDEIFPLAIADVYAVLSGPADSVHVNDKAIISLRCLMTRLSQH